MLGGNREQVVLEAPGKAAWTGPGGVRSEFNVGLAPGFSGGYCGFTSLGVVLVWESMGAVDGASGIAFFDRAKGDIGWAQFHGMLINVGPPLIHGDVLYFTGMGYVAALRVGDGKTIWERGGLWRPDRYHGFRVPEIRDDTVRFTDEGGNTLVVDLETGRILEGAPTSWTQERTVKPPPR